MSHTMTSGNRLAAIALGAALAVSCLPRAGLADERGGWRGGEIHRFHEHDFERWRGGNWWHGWHGDRDGWWWIVGGVWYWYPAPVYPYPDPYRPPMVAAAPGQFWYYCQNPAGYYPYVANCLIPWQAVPVTQQPPQPPQPPMPPMPPPPQ